MCTHLYCEILAGWRWSMTRERGSQNLAGRKWHTLIWTRKSLRCSLKAGMSWFKLNRPVTNTFTWALNKNPTLTWTYDTSDTLKTHSSFSRLLLLLQMWEGRLQQIGHILLHVALIVVRGACVQSDADFTLFHQVKHVGEDGGVHRQTCPAQTTEHPSNTHWI